MVVGVACRRGASAQVINTLPGAFNRLGLPLRMIRKYEQIPVEGGAPTGENSQVKKEVSWCFHHT